MSTVFESVLDMSLHGSVLILAVLLFRVLFRKAPRSLIVATWAIAAVRLVWPMLPQSAVSLMPAVHPSSTAGETLSLTVVDEVLVLPIAVPDTSDVTLWSTLAIVWLLGVLVMLTYTVAAYHRTRKTLREAVRLENDIYQCDRIPTPFIFGLLRPCVYLPSAMKEEDRPYVIAHERAHIARWDHVWKPLGFAVLSLHWFNPLVWLGYVLFCRDMETACDERVLRRLGSDSKKPYADALINCAAPTRRIAACPLAFGETDVKTRVRMVLRYQKPARWITIACAGIGIALMFCFLTDPRVKALEPIVQTPVSDSAVSQTPTRPTKPEPTILQYSQSMSIESIAPRAVKAGETVTVRVAVQDSRGVQSGVDVLLYRETEDGDFEAVGETITLTCVQGDAVDGVYEGTITVPAGTKTGDYRLRATYIPVSEKPAVCTAYTPEGEAAVTIE